MSLLSIVLLALGVSMDAAAVSAARGMAVRKVTAKHAALVAVWFGGAQALMPALGAWLGRRVGPFIEAWDHWIAFAVLAGIGVKMAYEARGEAERVAAADPFAPYLMLALAIATSIDALAVGVTLPLLGAPLGLSIATIGLTTAALSVLGLHAGRRFGSVFGRRVELFGGLVLIGIGTKILLEHLL